jgi:hypothetical protein
MTTSTLVSKTGAPIIELWAWVQSKNDPALTALHDQHVAAFQAGTKYTPMENPAMDNMFNQFFAETNQELVTQ